MKNRTSNFLIILIAIIVAIALLLTYCNKKSHTSKVYFGNLRDGAQVESPFKVEMKAENLVVEPASKGINAGHGHFHIIIDSPLPTAGLPVPMDSLHIHYGNGQTNAMLDLPEGEHMLTLQFADGAHIPYDPQITETVRIHVTRQNVPAVGSGNGAPKSMKMDTIVNSSGAMTITPANQTRNTRKTGQDSTPHIQPPIIPGMGNGAGGSPGGMGAGGWAARTSGGM